MTASPPFPHLAHVEGWLTEAQAGRLHAAAARTPPDGRIVEIGSFRGRSTIVLALGAPQAGEIVAIDPHAGNDRGPQERDGYRDAAETDFETFHANLERAGFEGRVRHVRRFSNDAETEAEVSGPIDLLYVDGSHRYGAARDDIRRWAGRLPPGGTLLVHDAFSAIGLTFAILRTLQWPSRFTYVGRDGSLAEYRAETGRAPITSTVRQLLQLPWFLRNIMVKVLLTAHLGRVTRLLGHDGHTWPY